MNPTTSRIGSWHMTRRGSGSCLRWTTASCVRSSAPSGSSPSRGQARHPRRNAYVPRLTQRLDDEDSDSEFLVQEYRDDGAPSTIPPGDAYLSEEVRAMMHALDTSVPAQVQPAEPSTTPKIYYASRTHSQLTQLLSELKRTPFGRANSGDPAIPDPVRAMSLGSRKQMCIHADVQRIGRTFGTEAMNERCLEMMESGSTCES